jgi:hypothetical protein
MKRYRRQEVNYNQMINNNVQAYNAKPIEHYVMVEQSSQTELSREDDYRNEIQMICLIGLLFFIFGGGFIGVFIWICGGIWLLNTKSKVAKRYGKALVLITLSVGMIFAIPIIVGAIFSIYTISNFYNDMICQ